MSDPSLALLDVALNAAAVAAKDPLALLQEGSIKIAMIKGLLQRSRRIPANQRGLACWWFPR